MKFKPDQKCIVWKMKRIQGKTEVSLVCDVALVASMRREKAWSKPPIKMSFQVPMFMSSGIHVRYLKLLEKSGYTSTKWIRYLTKTGQYEHRIVSHFIPSGRSSGALCCCMVMPYHCHSELNSAYFCSE